MFGQPFPFLNKKSVYLKNEISLSKHDSEYISKECEDRLEIKGRKMSEKTVCYVLIYSSYPNSEHIIYMYIARCM